MREGADLGTDGFCKHQRPKYEGTSYACLSRFMLTSSNSQGSGDSEIALVIEDEDMLESTMDGKPYMASRFAATLRRKLYRGSLHSTSRFLF